MVRFGGLIEAVEHILLIATEARDRFPLAEIRDGVIARLIGRGHDDFVDPARFTYPIHHVPEHGTAADLGETLARQTSRGHARLDDCDNHAVTPFLIATEHLERADCLAANTTSIKVTASGIGDTVGLRSRTQSRKCCISSRYIWFRFQAAGSGKVVQVPGEA